MKKNVLIGVMVLALLAAGIALTWHPSTTDDGWKTLTPGSPDAATPNMIKNGNFDGSFIGDWRETKEVAIKPETITHGERVAKAGRGGSPAFHFPAAAANSARVAAVQTVLVTHADFYLDGFVQAKSMGKAWVGIEFTFEGKNGPLATYLCYAARPDTPRPHRENGLVMELTDAGDGWSRLPLRTSWDLREAGLALKEPPTSITVRLWMDLNEGGSEAWFDDIEVKDMKAGHGGSP